MYVKKHFYELFDSRTRKSLGICKAPVVWESMAAYLKAHPGHYCKKVDAPDAQPKPIELKETTMDDKIRRLASIIKRADGELTRLNAETPDVPLPRPKYANFLCRIKKWASSVPTEDRREEEIVRSALFANVDYHLRKRGPVPIATRAYADGRTFTVPHSPIMGAQISKDLDKDVDERVDAAMRLAEEIRKEDNYIVGRVRDLLLYIPKKHNLLNDDFLEMTARLKAGTLLTKDGPAINEFDVEFVTNSRDVASICDGGVWAIREIILPQIHEDLHPIINEHTKDDTLTMGGRIITNETNTDAELAKFNMGIIPGSEYVKMFKKLTGRKWTKNDPFIMIPKETMKNYRGDGRRSMTFQWLTGAYITKKCVTHEKVSLGEHMSSRYTDVTLTDIQETLAAQSLSVCEALSAAELCRNLLVSVDEDEIDMILAAPDGDEAAGKLMVKKLATNSKEWAEHKLPLQKIMAELVPFLVKRITNGLALRDTVFTIKGIASIYPLPAGKHAALPTHLVYPIHMKCTMPAWLETFTCILTDHIVINLKGAVEHNGCIMVKRTPVVNGKYKLLPDDIEWKSHSQACRFSSALTYLLNADYDGDFFKFSGDYPVDHVDIDRAAKEMHAMGVSIDKAMTSLVLDDKDIPTWKGEADVSAPIKEVCKRAEKDFPNAGISSVIRTLYVNKMVGPSTNASNDCIIQSRSKLLAHVRGYTFIGGMGRAMSEGPIHLIKHADTKVQMDGNALRRYWLPLVKSVLDIDLHPATSTSVLTDERIARLGIKMDKLLIPSDWEIRGETVDEKYADIKAGIEDLIDEKKQNLAEGNGYYSTRPQRVLTTAERISYLKVYEHLHAAELHPVYHKAIASIKLTLEWMVGTDDNFDAKVKELMPMIVDIEKKQTSSYHRDLSMFYSIFDDTGKINYDKNNIAGGLAYNYFMGGKAKNKEIVAALRIMRGIFPAYIVLSNLYTDVMGVSTPTVLLDGFTNAELHTARRLIDAISFDGDNVDLPADACLDSKHGEFYIKRDADPAIHAKFQALYVAAYNDGIVKDMKEFRRALCTGQTGKAIRILPNGNSITLKEGK